MTDLSRFTTGEIRAELDRKCKLLSPAEVAKVGRFLDALAAGTIPSSLFDAYEGDTSGYVAAVDRILDEVGA